MTQTGAQPSHAAAKARHAGLQLLQLRTSVLPAVGAVVALCLQSALLARWNLMLLLRMKFARDFGRHVRSTELVGECRGRGTVTNRGLREPFEPGRQRV